MELSEFLLARIAEDEERARTFLADNHAALMRAELSESALALVVRVLAECEAKRQIVDLHRAVPVAPGRRELTCVEDGALTWPCPTLRFLAAPYADHPDYRGAWRP